jgi:hypothetical protein
MKLMTKKAEKYKRKCREILAYKDKELGARNKSYVSLKEKLRGAKVKMTALKEHL